MSILVTGITGFVGSHLAEYLLDIKSPYPIYGTIRRRSNLTNIANIQHELRFIECDITDYSVVCETIKESEPAYIFHLAAQTFVPTSWRAPYGTLYTNIFGTLNLLEAIRKSSFDPTILVAGSSEEYGKVMPEELPITEETPLRPMSPYAVSKIVQDKLAYQYHQSYGIKAIITRAFNHTGPKRPEFFVCSSFAKQIIEIENNKASELYVGNLDAKRDFSDVRDIVRAYWLASQKCQFGEVYNICSGKARSIRSILDLLVSFSKEEIKIQQDPSRMRPSDVPILECNCAKFRKETGWKPQIPFEKTLQDLLEYWRNHLKSN